MALGNPSRASDAPRHAGDERPKVLVIEDTPEVRRAVQRSLHTLGMTVLVAASGEEGLACVRRERPHLVLTDVNMPGIDGFQVLQSIRNDPATATTPVVLMTARDDRASVRRGMILGADDYLTKPFTAQEIRETVQARLEHHSRLNAALQKTQDALWQATHLDPETGLPNRTAFRDRLGATDAPSLVIAVLELDRYERLQSAFQTLRPELLPAIVREIASRLSRSVGATGTVYRLENNRFGILDLAVREPREAHAWADSLLAELRRPVGGEELELRVTASAGVAHWKPGTVAALATAAHAEAAAYHARESGGNHAALYDPELHSRAYNRLVLESSMNRALDRNQFELHYQPQVSASAGKVLGVEALIRWRHPELGMVSPFHFIPIAEETGLIVEIGAWVLRTACAQVQAWRGEVPNMRVAVNLSALQLRDERLVDTVLSALKDSGLPPTHLKLELTESMMVQAGVKAAEQLRTLRDLGVGISIDDFGTGYSSLANLRSFPVGEVKIDRSFVRHVPDDRDNCSIVAAVIAMAHQLGLRVVAEGVEEEAQLAFLQQRGCDDIQGYYFSKPLPVADFLPWLRSFGDKAARKVQEPVA